jgi:RNA polymerase sigma-70 factor (ECF subfamily)
MAFARLVAAYHADLVRVAFVVAGGSQDIADDAVQAAWTIAWRKLGTVRDPERIKPWLIAIAANEARQLCRKGRRAAVAELHIDTPALQLPDQANADPAARADALDLESAMAGLSPDERTLLALRYEAGFDSGEIGRILGRPAATIRWRLATLVARLRKELRDA